MPQFATNYSVDSKDPITPDPPKNSNPILEGYKSLAKFWGDLNPSKLPVVAPPGMPLDLMTHTKNVLTSLFTGTMSMGSGLYAAVTGSDDPLLGPVGRAGKYFAGTIGSTAQSIGNLAGDALPYISAAADYLVTQNKDGLGYDNLYAKHKELLGDTLDFNNAWISKWEDENARKALSNDVNRSVLEAGELARSEVPMPEGYEQSKPSEFLNPFNQHGMYFYPQIAAEALGFMAPGIIAGKGITAGSGALARKAAEMSMSKSERALLRSYQKGLLGVDNGVDRLGKTIERLNTADKAGQQLGYIASTMLNSQYEANVESYQAYKDTRDLLRDQYIEELILQGYPKEEAERLGGIRAEEIGMAVGQEVIKSNLGILNLMNSFELRLLGAGPQKVGVDSILDIVEKNARTKIKKNLDGLGKAVLAGVPESIQELQQSGITNFYKDNLAKLGYVESGMFLDQESGITDFVYNGLKEGVNMLAEGSKEAYGGLIGGFGISGGITGLNEFQTNLKNKDYVNNSFKYYGLDRNNFQFMEVRPEVGENGVLSPKLRPNEVEMMLTAKKIDTDLNRKIAADLKYENDSKDAKIDHLSDLAEDSHILDLLYKNLEQSTTARPEHHVDRLTTVLADYYKRQNQSKIYQGREQETGSLTRSKHAVLSKAAANYQLAQYVSKNLQGGKTFTKQVYDILNAKEKHTEYRDYAQAGLNGIPEPDINSPENQVLVEKYNQDIKYFNSLIEYEQKRYSEYATVEAANSQQAVDIAIEAIMDNPETPEEVIANTETTDEIKDKALEIVKNVPAEKRQEMKQYETLMRLPYKDFTAALEDMAQGREDADEFIEERHRDYINIARTEEQKLAGNNIVENQRIRPYHQNYGFLEQEDIKSFNTWANKIENKSRLLDGITTYTTLADRIIKTDENGVASIRIENLKQLNSLLTNPEVQINDVDLLRNVISPWFENQYNLYEDKTALIPQSNENADLPEHTMDTVGVFPELTLDEETNPVVIQDKTAKHLDSQAVKEMLTEDFNTNVKFDTAFAGFVTGLTPGYFTIHNKDKTKFYAFIPFGYEDETSFNEKAPVEFLAYLETVPNWEDMRSEDKTIFTSLVYYKYFTNIIATRSYINKKNNFSKAKQVFTIKYEINLNSRHVSEQLNKTSLKQNSKYVPPVWMYLTTENGEKLYLGLVERSGFKRNITENILRFAKTVYVRYYKDLVKVVPQANLTDLEKYLDAVPGNAVYAPRALSVELPNVTNAELNFESNYKNRRIESTDFSTNWILDNLSDFTAKGTKMSYHLFDLNVFTYPKKYSSNPQTYNKLIELVNYLVQHPYAKLEVERLEYYTPFTIVNGFFVFKDDRNKSLTPEQLLNVLSEQYALYQNKDRFYLTLDIGDFWRDSSSPGQINKNLYNKYLVDSGLLSLGYDKQGENFIQDVVPDMSVVGLNILMSESSTTTNSNISELLENTEELTSDSDIFDFMVAPRILDLKPGSESAQKAWFNKRFQSANIDISQSNLNHLYKGTLLGQKVWGAYRNALVQLVEGAPDLVLYHESWHLVEDIYLTPEQKRNVYREARIKYFNTEISESELEKVLLDPYQDHPLLTKISERLAEYVSTKLVAESEIKNSQSLLDKILQTLLDFIWRIPKNLLQQWFTDTMTVDEIIFSIDRATIGNNFFGFERSNAIKKNVDASLRRKNQEYSFSVEGWTQLQLKREIDFINKAIIYNFLESVENYIPEYVYNKKKRKKELTGKKIKADSFSQYFNWYKTTVDEKQDPYKLFYSEKILTHIWNKYKVLLDTGTLSPSQHLEQLAEKQIKALKKSPANKASYVKAYNEAYNELMTLINNLFNSDVFIERLVADLARTHDHSAKKLFKVRKDLEEFDDVENLSYEETEEQDGEEDTPVHVSFGNKKYVNPKKFLTPFLKYQLYSIPEISNVYTAIENGQKIRRVQYVTLNRGSLDLKYPDSDERYYQLIDVISEALTKSDILGLIRKNEAVYPWFTELLNRLPGGNGVVVSNQEKQLFLDQLWTKIAQFKFQPIGSLIPTENGQRKIFLLNQTNKNTALVRLWVRQFKLSQAHSAITSVENGNTVKVFNRTVNSVADIQKVFEDYIEKIRFDYANLSTNDAKSYIGLLKRISRGYAFLGLAVDYNKLKLLSNTSESFITDLKKLIGYNRSKKTGLFFYNANIKSFYEAVPKNGSLYDDSLEVIADLFGSTKTFNYLDYNGNNVTSYIPPNNLTMMMRILDHPEYSQHLIHIEKRFESAYYGHNAIAQDMKLGPNRRIIKTIVDISEDRDTGKSVDKLYDSELYKFLLDTSEGHPLSDRMYAFLGIKADNTRYWFADVKKMTKPEAQREIAFLVYDHMKTRSILEKNQAYFKSRGIKLRSELMPLEVPDSIYNKIKSGFKYDVIEDSDYVFQQLETVGFFNWFDTWAKNKERDYFDLLLDNGIVDINDLSIKNYYDKLGKADLNQTKNPFEIKSVKHTSALTDAYMGERLSDIYWSNQYYLMAVSDIEHGPLAFYGSNNNLVKRANQDSKPGNYINEYDVNKIEKVLYVNDIIKSSSNELLAALEKIHGSNSPLIESFKTNNTTDSWKLHTLKYGLDFARSDQKNVSEYEYWYDSSYGTDSNGVPITFGSIDPLDIEDFIVQTLKTHTTMPRNYDLIVDNIPVSVNTMYQEKILETVLMRQVAFRLKNKNEWAVPPAYTNNESFWQDLQKRYEYPKLAFVLHLLEKNNFDSIVWGGGIKTGHDYVYNLDKNGNPNLDLLKEDLIPTIVYKHWIKKQNEMPNALIGKNITIGSQQENLLMAGIDLDYEYVLDEPVTLEENGENVVYTKMSGRQLVDLKNRIDRADFLVKIEEAKKMSSIDGVAALLQDNIMAGLIDPNMWDYTFIKDDKLGLSLSHTSWGKRVFTMITSLFENKLNKSKTPKGYNSGGYGVDDSLNTYYDNEGNPEGLEFAAPIWSSALQMYILDQMRSTNKTPQQVIDKLLSDKDTIKMLEGIFYRTPTEANYSIQKGRYKKYIPEILGSIINFAKEIDTVMGSDKDADSFSSKMPILKYEDGLLYKIPAGLDSKDARHNLDLIWSKAVISSPAFKKGQWRKGGPDILNDLAHKFGTDFNYYDYTTQYKLQGELNKSLSGISINAAKLRTTAKLINQIRFVKGAENGLMLPINIGFDKLYNNLNATQESLLLRGPFMSKQTDASKTPLDLYYLGLNNITQPIVLEMLNLSNDKTQYLDDLEYYIYFVKQPVIAAYVKHLNLGNYFRQEQSGKEFMRNLHKAIDALLILSSDKPRDQAKEDLGFYYKELNNYQNLLPKKDLISNLIPQDIPTIDTILSGWKPSTSVELAKVLKYYSFQYQVLRKFMYIEKVNRNYTDIAMFLREDHKRLSDKKFSMIQYYQGLVRIHERLRKEDKDPSVLDVWKHIMPVLDINTNGKFYLSNYTYLEEGFKADKTRNKPLVFQRLLYNTLLKIDKLNTVADYYPYLTAEYYTDVYDNLGIMYGPDNKVYSEQIDTFERMAENMFTAHIWKQKLEADNIDPFFIWKRAVYGLHIAQSLINTFENYVDRKTLSFVEDIPEDVKDYLNDFIKNDSGYLQKMFAFIDNYKEIFSTYTINQEIFENTGLYPVSLNRKFLANDQEEKLQYVYLSGLLDDFKLPHKLIYPRNKTEVSVAQIFNDLKTFAYIFQGVDRKGSNIANLLPKKMIVEDTEATNFETLYWRNKQSFIPQLLEHNARAKINGYSKKIFSSSIAYPLESIDDNLVSFVLKPYFIEANNQLVMPRYVNYEDVIYRQDDALPMIYYRQRVTSGQYWNYFTWLPYSDDTKFILPDVPFSLQSDENMRRQMWTDYYSALPSTTDYNDIKKAYTDLLNGSKSLPVKSVKKEPNRNAQTVFNTIGSPGAKPLNVGLSAITIDNLLSGKTNVLSLAKPIKDLPSITEGPIYERTLNNTKVLIKYRTKLERSSIKIDDPQLNTLLDNIKAGQGAIIFGVTTSGKSYFAKNAPTEIKDRIVDLDIVGQELLQPYYTETVTAQNYGSLFSKLFFDRRDDYEKFVTELVEKARELKSQGKIVLTPNNNFLSGNVADIAVITKNSKRVSDLASQTDRDNSYTINEEKAQKSIDRNLSGLSEFTGNVYELKDYQFLSDLFESASTTMYVEDTGVIKKRRTPEQIANILNQDINEVEKLFGRVPEIYVYNAGVVKKQPIRATIQNPMIGSGNPVLPIEPKLKATTAESLAILNSQKNLYVLENPHDRFYKDANGNLYDRASNIASGFNKNVSEALYKKFQNSLSSLSDAFELGSFLERPLKDYLSGSFTTMAEYENQSELVPNEVLADFNILLPFYKDLVEDLIVKHDFQDYVILSDVPAIKAVLNINSTAVGTPDILIVSGNRVIIIDIKTSSVETNLINRSNPLGAAYTVSQNIYAKGLEQLGFEISGIYLMPLGIKKDSNGQVVNIYGKNLQKVAGVKVENLGSIVFNDKMTIESIKTQAFINNKNLRVKC